MQSAESQFQVFQQQCFTSQGESVCAASVKISYALRMTLIAADQRPPVAQNSRVPVAGASDAQTSCHHANELPKLRVCTWQKNATMYLHSTCKHWGTPISLLCMSSVRRAEAVAWSRLPRLGQLALVDSLQICMYLYVRVPCPLRLAR